MKRMTTICKGAALLLAVALLTLPLLGLAAPAAEARTLDSATVSGKRLYALFFMGMSRTEIAKAEGVAVKSVCESIVRALETLRKNI